MSKKVLPRVVYQMCVNGAYIAGSKARDMVTGKDNTTSDWDLIVPPDKWSTVSLLIPKDAKLNNFGGIRFNFKGEEIDVWCGSIIRHLEDCKIRAGEPVVVVDFINNRVIQSSFQEL